MGTSGRALVLLLVLAACSRSRPPAEKAAQPPPPDPVTDPAVLVVVHSYSGRTATVGREIASMLGGRFVSFGDGFVGGTTAPGQPSLADLGSLSLAGVTVLYLGFPIWGEQPTDAARRFVEGATLQGLQVVPFYTALHYVDPAALEGLAAGIAERGGVPLAPLAFRAPMATTDEELARLARRAILSRHRGAAELAPSCAAGPVHHGGMRCRIPAGAVWLGDTGDDAPPGAAPPRLVQLPAYEIDRAEVTTEQYRRCHQAGACPAVDNANSFCRVLLEGDDGTRPQPCASYQAAASYCAWAQGRLPSEVEWIRAGRGDTTATYPWGDEPPGRGAPRANLGETEATGHPHYSVQPAGQGWPVDGVAGLAPPCSFPLGTSALGICDLAGNLAEWVTADDSSALVKGGSWLDADSGSVRLGARARPTVGPDGAPVGFYLVGFRCAW